MPLPDAPLLRLYRELGGEIITLGSDAHSAEYVGCAIRERQELLRSAASAISPRSREASPGSGTL